VDCAICGAAEGHGLSLAGVASGMLDMCTKLGVEMVRDGLCLVHRERHDRACAESARVLLGEERPS
jgi:hypothetical protein